MSECFSAANPFVCGLRSQRRPSECAVQTGWLVLLAVRLGAGAVSAFHPELKGEHFNVTLFVRFGAFVEMGVIITGGGGNQLGIVKLCVCMCVLQPTVAAESSAWAEGRNPGLLLQLRLSWARVYFGSSTFLGDL